VLEAWLEKFIPVLWQHNEMVSQLFDIKISVIMSKQNTFKQKLGLANTIFRKAFGLTLKGKRVKTGKPFTFELHLMDCFTYVNGVFMLKMPCSKLIKSMLQPLPKSMVPLIDDPTATPPVPAVHKATCPCSAASGPL